MLVGQRPAGAQEVFGTLENSAFAKDRLEHDGASVGIDRGAQRFDVVLRDEGHVFEHGLKTFAVLVLTGEGHGSKGSAVIGALQSHKLGFGIAACFVPGETCEFDGAFHGLGAAVREEDAVKTG